MDTEESPSPVEEEKEKEKKKEETEKEEKKKKWISKPTVQDNVLPRAEIIRSKLIHSFYLLDHMQEELRGTPKYSTKDVLDPAVLNRLMLEDSHQLMRFEICPLRCSVITDQDRRRNRLKNRCAYYPPLNMWAHWVLESEIFVNTILFLIILNTIVLGVQAEVFDNMDPSMDMLKLALDVLDWSILDIFLIEILLKWIDNFVSFWKSTWNIFDFVVTVLSILPELMKAQEGLNSSNLDFVKLIRIFRILRSLKMVSKFRQVRIIVLAISKAFKAMSFILLLLVVFTYIFAVAGVIFFQSYTRSDRPDLIYNKNFKDIPSTFVTLFILFTMDHWYALLQDTRKVADLDQAICGLYIILWLLIGSFIFRNIFVGIMVNNFQMIRNDLSKEVKQIEIQQRADLFKAEIINRRMSQMKLTDGPAQDPPPEGSSEEPSSEQTATELPVHTVKPTASATDWNAYVEDNLSVMRDQEEDEKVTWPRDSLFRYFELLEKLQYNLETRKRLQNVAAQALMNFHTY
ncbi:cation channel sperm-associated protein 2-like isoform X2 [Acipenser ruthenus]|uniref:cation channel sperm-associated protein 2-like isoform X2 n=1 Tax=Acipenser ruthenus TaxID=7906 RepID=UPI00145ABB9F|nr:cation channel sperm-associated protein 2-like isoform X2 [Acipenser ruthenus]